MFFIISPKVWGENKNVGKNSSLLQIIAPGEKFPHGWLPSQDYHWSPRQLISTDFCPVFSGNWLLLTNSSNHHPTQATWVSTHKMIHTIFHHPKVPSPLPLKKGGAHHPIPAMPTRKNRAPGYSYVAGNSHLWHRFLRLSDVLPLYSQHVAGHVRGCCKGHPLSLDSYSPWCCDPGLAKRRKKKRVF